MAENVSSLKPTRSSHRKQPVSPTPQRNVSRRDGHGYVVGVDIGGTNVRVALADLCGTVVGKWTASTRKTSSARAVVERIREGVSFLLQRASIPRASLLAVAAGAPGVTDAAAGVVFATSYLRGWTNVPLRRLLEAALSVPAAIENDVRVAAIGEKWCGAARDIDDFVFLAIGTGIAAGIFVNGELVRGKDSAAGEVGYMLVPGGPEEAAKQGEPGSLESLIGGEGVKLQWLNSCRNRSRSELDLSATEIFGRAQAGNSHARSILDRSARMLAYAIYNLSLVLNSSLFILGGGVGMSIPLLESTRRILRQYKEPVRPKLALSSLGQDAQLMGTIRLALDLAESRTRLKK
jgi:glucokinase